MVRAKFERWRARPADVVIADPARAGLGKPGAAVVAGTGAHTVVLVSCEAAALARDVRLLVDHGFTYGGSTVVDLFPHTHHVEVVTRLSR